MPGSASTMTSMNRLLRYLLPGFVFAVGWIIEAVTDHWLRMADGDIHTGGFERQAWFGLHIGLAAVAIVVALWAYRSLPVWLRVLLIVVQLTVGFPIYVLACIGYGVGTGIDTL